MANSNALPSDKVSLSAEIVAAYVSHNSVTPGGLPGLIESVHGALTNLGAVAAPPKAEPLVPAVSVRKSITPEYLICLDDGKRFKSLKRHITLLGMTPDQYRTKWGLPASYPMVAPAYAAKRSELAKAIGLGQLRKDTRKGKSPASSRQWWKRQPPKTEAAAGTKARLRLPPVVNTYFAPPIAWSVMRAGDGVAVGERYAM
jgi:predicted transcriptional regulator